LITIAGLVATGDLEAIRTTVANGRFVSGKNTALGNAARVKNNLQLDERCEAARSAREKVLRVIREHGAFQTATWIAAMVGPLFCRYDEGMGYGDHVDSPLMGQGLARMRCDLAVTILLSRAADYEGGELMIDVDRSAQTWKGDAGDCMIYPADTLHRVAPIRRGTRLAAILWIQTLVRDPSRRKLLFELATAIRDLDETHPGSGPVERVRRSYTNLIRMWVEPEIAKSVENAT
jgi:PKHD-type hydroxylase